MYILERDYGYEGTSMDSAYVELWEAVKYMLIAQHGNNGSGLRLYHAHGRHDNESSGITEIATYFKEFKVSDEKYTDILRVAGAPV